MYKLPLFKIVGVTCTGLTFTIAFAYIEAESEKNFVWVLERSICLFRKHDELAKVIVLDRHLALMNAVKIVLPKCITLSVHAFTNFSLCGINQVSFP